MLLLCMVKIPPIFTRDVDEEKAELLRVPAFTSTPYPFRAQSTYIPPEADPPKPKHEVQRGRRPGLWSSIALRFSGFTSQLRNTVGPLNGVKRASVARNFFANRLAEASSLSSRNPESAHRIIAKATRGAQPIWRSLLLVGCGDGSALAPAMAAIEEIHHADEDSLADCLALVARQRPGEGRYLVKHAVKYLSTSAQLRMLRVIVDNEAPGSTRLVGELFETIMEQSTAAERKSRIYPMISGIVSEDVGRKSPARGFLGALLSGWLSECPD